MYGNLYAAVYKKVGTPNDQTFEINRRPPMTRIARLTGTPMFLASETAPGSSCGLRIRTLRAERPTFLCSQALVQIRSPDKLGRFLIID
jgi:hypothetical protein